MLAKGRVFREGKVYEEGDFDPDNGYEVRADCYNLTIEELKNV